MIYTKEEGSRDYSKERAAVITTKERVSVTTQNFKERAPVIT